MAHAIGMKEIALQAGVSLATVDRVLHRRPGVHPATQRRVRQAQVELDRQQAQVGLRGRRFLVDLVMETPERFSRIVRDALHDVVGQVHPAVFRVREHLAETMAIEQLVEVLDAIGRRGSHGVLLKAPDVATIGEAVTRLHERGIPVVTLVTDIHHPARVAYVGLDNRSAGLTAAYLMHHWMGAATADVLVSGSDRRFLGEGERIAAFIDGWKRARPHGRVRIVTAGHGLHDPTVAAVSHRWPGIRSSPPSTRSAAPTPASWPPSIGRDVPAASSSDTTSTRTTSRCCGRDACPRCCTTTCTATCCTRVVA